MSDVDEHHEAFWRVRRQRLDVKAAEMWRTHPDLDSERDCTVLTWEDIQEVKWLDCEIAIEHTLGVHRDGCPPGCLYRLKEQER